MPRIRSDGGFLLIELVVAMSILAIGILALIGTYTTGYITVDRASVRATASTLADTSIEADHGLTYAALVDGTTTITYSTSTTPPSPDGRTYTVATTVATSTADNTSGATARTVKTITVAVTDSAGQVQAREQSVIERLTR